MPDETVVELEIREFRPEKRTVPASTKVRLLLPGGRQTVRAAEFLTVGDIILGEGIVKRVIVREIRRSATGT